MVHPFGVLDGLDCALHGLNRMALQPQCPRQGDAGSIVPVVGKIDRPGPLGARPNRQQGLELDAGNGKVSHDQQRPP